MNGVAYNTDFVDETAYSSPLLNTAKIAGRFALLQSRQDGSTSPFYQRAEMLFYGPNNARDRDEAVRLYQMAVDDGDAEACDRLAQFYQTGIIGKDKEGRPDLAMAQYYAERATSYSLSGTGQRLKDIIEERAQTEGGMAPSEDKKLAMHSIHALQQSAFSGNLSDTGQMIKSESEPRASWREAKVEFSKDGSGFVIERNGVLERYSFPPRCLKAGPDLK